MENYDVEANRLSRALERKAFHNVKVHPRFTIPGAMDIDPQSIILEFADQSQAQGEFEELKQRIDAADSEKALQDSFDWGQTIPSN